MKRSAGFTLIELLIVVAVIAILAAIAVPNFLEAQTRSRVARVDNDLRTIALAMEAYYVDNGGYPAAELFFGGTAVTSDRRLLTSPISYLDSVPDDVFRKIAGMSTPWYRVYAVCSKGRRDATFGTNPESPYRMYPRDVWMTWSYGPDQLTQTAGYRSVTIDVIYNESLPVEQQAVGKDKFGNWIAASNYHGMRYDPTNGTISIGDIYRFGGGKDYSMYDESR
jgi:type II secretion system protein G